MRRTILATAALATLAAPALARPGGPGWGGPGWGGGMGWDSRSSLRDRQPSGPAEGKVEVTRFVAEDGDLTLLGKGAASVAPMAGATSDKVFEAAVENSLVGIGYRTDVTADQSATLVEVRVSHDTVVPEEAPHKPVSGEMEVGVSNRGSMMGLGLNIDLSKPKKALVGTRLEARIKDKASGKVLWEGRADIVTRDGSDKWTDSAIAAKLSQALFDRFPGKSGETRTALR
jgi:hypothetical protein